ncbi:MAG: PEP-CTERM sorting domain-containing protein [Verrucomicrobia bacterium]|jgi:hypothetical protein|nr:PEP-CTERM sorting domain-containing protein [Verrucomicrobiota bacterium]
MKLKNLLLSALTACALLGAALESRADVSYTVDPGATWIGYMNVFALPSVGNYPPSLGGYEFGSGWGTGDLVAYFTGPVLTLAPNTINDPNEYWYTPSGGPGSVGNKIMDASMYVEVGSLPGQTVTFTGTVLSDTLTLANNPGNVDANGNGWTSVAFIKDFAPDYSSFVTTTVPLAPGNFSISLATINDPARHVQYGFETIGPDVWITDVGPFGNITITVPEPSTLALAGLSAAALLIFRRRS